MSTKSRFSVKLFYSYSHKDYRYREEVERSLTLLRDQDRILDDWSDQQILPGQRISNAILERMQKTDIFVFLVSQHFIASAACREEWTRAEQICKERLSVRVPIILSDCSWKDLEGMSQLKALPEDGTPVKRFRNRDTAWQQIYKGLKDLIEHLRSNFSIRDAFRDEIERTDFLSQDHIRLQDMFVFPSIASYSTPHDDDTVERLVAHEDELTENAFTLIHGERLSGKTALCRHLLLRLADRSAPVLYVDLEDVGRRPHLRIFRANYARQFHGDYTLWDRQKEKTIILDNLSAHSINHLMLAIEHFERIIVTVSTDTFYAYYRDDDRLAKFKEFKMLPLSHSKQEKLIRRRLELSGHDKPVLDSHIDAMEIRVNEVIINNRILPRYPFYILSILQTREGFMPHDLPITSYGHCYYILIVAHFFKSGISKADDVINACLNFAEHLAFKIFKSGADEQTVGVEFLDEFKNEYAKKFIPLKHSTLNRMSDPNYGIITKTGFFRRPYMYYFFLGKHLSKNRSKYANILERILDRSYTPSNFLTLIFTIHHTSDSHLIDDILIRTMCALDEIEPSTLNDTETKIFEDLIKAIPASILSANTIQSEREKERETRDHNERDGVHELPNGTEENREGSMAMVNDIYRIMKNNEILGQILKNKYGTLERQKVVEIIETIADGGLRLVRLLMADPKEINYVAAFVHERHPESDIDEVRQTIRAICFFWTMHNVEKIVAALNKPEIRKTVGDVVGKRNTPAYDLIEYFLHLDTTEKFSDEDYDKLKSVLRNRRFPFFRKVVSLRTQHYLNTHRVRTPVEQRVCSLLGIRYRPRAKRLS